VNYFRLRAVHEAKPCRVFGLKNKSRKIVGCNMNSKRIFTYVQLPCFLMPFCFTEVVHSKQPTAAAYPRLQSISRDKDLWQLQAMAGESGAGDTERSSGPKFDASYGAKIAARIKRNTRFLASDAIPGNPTIEYELELFPDGSVKNIKILHESGYPAFDEAVKRAVYSTAPFERDPETGKIPTSMTVTQRLKETTSTAASQLPPKNIVPTSLRVETFSWRGKPNGLLPRPRTWSHSGDGPVYSVAFSPDGRLVATGSSDKTAVLRDVSTGSILFTWPFNGSVYSVTFSPDSRYVLIGSGDKSTTIVNAVSGSTLNLWMHDVPINSVAFSPDSQYVLTGTADQGVILREVSTGNVIHTAKHSLAINAVAFSPDGQFALTGSTDKSAILREVKTFRVVHAWKHDGPVYDVAFTPDGRLAATASGDNTVVLREVATGKAVNSWRYSGSVYGARFSPDSRYLLAGTSDKTVSIRDINSGKILKTLAYKRAVSSVAFSPDGTQILVGQYGGEVAISGSGLSNDFSTALNTALGFANAEHQRLPSIFINRKSKLVEDPPVKDEFESIATYNQRVANWNKAIEKLNSEIKSYYAELGPLPIDKRVKAFEQAFLHSYGNPYLHEIRYDPETARFFATLKASIDSDFKRTISIPVPNDQARSVKAQLESDKNGLEIELRVTEKNELIWGQPFVRIDNREVVAQFVDKDFVPPSVRTLTADSQLKTIVVPNITPLPQVANAKVIEDPGLNKLQMEVLERERERTALAARQAEEKRLKDRLAELNREGLAAFNDDLPGLISKLPATKSNPRLHVLAIGINDYADVPDVPFADRSAQQFAEISQKLLGAQPQNVIVLTDSQATLGRLLSRLNTLLNRLGPQDQLLFYYAGHGVPSKDGAGAYLLAQDGGPGSYEQPDLQLGQIYTVIAKSRVGQAKIFIDACFSGRSGKDSIVFEGIAPIVVKQKQSFPNSDRIAVMTAGRGDQFSNQDKARGHRLFSYHLMRLILEDGVKLEIGQLHQRLRQRVLEDSRRIGPEFEQEPELQGNGRMALLNQ
jgi:TonB family protein